MHHKTEGRDVEYYHSIIYYNGIRKMVSLHNDVHAYIYIYIYIYILSMKLQTSISSHASRLRLSPMPV